MSNVEIRHCDALDLLRSLGDGSVNLIATDPPYFKVKPHGWDRQWDKATGFLAWCGVVLDEMRRVLAPNGSLYWFASPQMAARIECVIRDRFDVLNHIVWAKPTGYHQGTCRETLRGYFPQTERIIFAEQHGSDSMAAGEAGYVAACDKLRGFVFEPLRAYLAGEWERAGLTVEDAREAVGCAPKSGLPSHWFSTSQWALPTAKRYAQLREYANRDGGEFLRREYEDLRREYEDLRRPFQVSNDVPYTDVWTYKTVQSYPGKHPCEKPAQMMLDIVNASSRPGDLVCDPFAGSGSTAVACAKSGRRFIGCDMQPKWVERATLNVVEAMGQGEQLELAAQ